MTTYASYPITLRQCQYIVAVDEERHFRKAAERCHVSQPSLSAQVAELERMLDIKIFERSRKGTWPTPAGEKIIQKARLLLLQTDELLALARLFQDPFEGALRLGIIPTLAPYLLPDIDPLLRETYPKLDLYWTENKTEVLLKQLNEGTLDVALLALEADLGEVAYEPLYEDHFVLATATTHTLAKDPSPIDLRDLLTEHVLLLEDGHCFREQALELCSRAGVRELGFRATSLTTLCQMVAGGMGITLLPTLSLEVENRRGQLSLRSIKAPLARRTVILCWRKHAAREDAYRHIAHTTRRCFPAPHPKI